MINEKRLIENFITLIKIDSPTGFESNIVKFLQAFLIENNLVDETNIDSFGNLYARKKGAGEPLFFTDHLDTVEPGRSIKPIVSNGYIQSDGTTILGADDKASVAAILEMLFVLKEQNIQHHPLECIFTISEEIGNLGAINFDYSLLKAKTGFCFDCSWPLGTFVTASPFYERFDLDLIGKSAHASRPELAINVLPALVEVLNNTTLGALDNETIFNIGVVNGGSVRNTILGIMHIEGEIRSFNERKLERYKASFMRQIKKTLNNSEVTFKIEWVRENPGFKLSTREVKRLAQKITPAINNCEITLNPTELWSVSDTNIFMQHNLACINLGSGREFAHTTRERINVQNLSNLAKLMIQLSQI